MTLQSNVPIPLWDLCGHSTAGSVLATAFVLDAANEGAAYIFDVRKAGTINKIAFYVAAHTTGATMECEVQTISTTTGLPSGTKFGSSTTGTVVTSGTGWYEATLSTGAAVVLGDRIAIVVKQPSSSPGNCAIGDLVNWYASTSYHGWPMGAIYVSSWAAATNLRRPLIFPGYDDSTYGFCPFNFPVTSFTTTSFASNSTPDEVGNRFNLVVPVRIVGVRMLVNPAADGRDFVISLYSDSTLLQSRTVDSGQFGGSALYWADFYFSATQDCSTGIHRITMAPQTTSNNQYTYATIPSLTGIRHALPSGVDTYFTSRTDGGSFSDTSTQLAIMIPLVAAFDDGAAGGGGGHSILTRRGLSTL